jgi:hypothetical protein
MISGFNSIRNSEIRHGGHRLDPVGTAKLLRVQDIGDAAAAGELKMPATLPLADHREISGFDSQPPFAADKEMDSRT